MKMVKRSVPLLLLPFLLTSCITRTLPPNVARNPGARQLQSDSSETTAAEPANSAASWPRVVSSSGTTNLVYEPKVDSWDGYHLVARDAVEIQGAPGLEPAFGVVTIRGTTLVNKNDRTVDLSHIEITGGDFPSAKSHEYVDLTRKSFPKELAGLSLDHLRNSFNGSVQPSARASEPLNNTAPKIIFSTKPAVLVLIDGPPIYRPVEGADLQRAINTRMLVLKDKSGSVYVRVLDGYMEAPAIDGPWKVASHAPAGAAQAEEQARRSADPPEFLEASTESATNSAAPPSLASGAPDIYVATQPSELVMFEGQPNFAPVEGTHLLYAANTSGNVFKLLTDQKTYVLISGRWFRGASLQGPWEYVPAGSLPSDFANIPDDSPKENVKASVAGTTQATEALIANSIPDTTRVPRSTQMQPPQIDGEPRLRSISGTPLSYVENSGTPIIKVDDHAWFACQNGVWFSAGSLSGPWVVATSVPAVIYTIPPSSPLHYLTYVRVYAADGDYVDEGYTPGYFGAETEDGVVVYGTGYYYEPWVGYNWYGYPVTWGCGWGVCWTPWDDWCFAAGFGWGCGHGHYGWAWCHPPHPWWGPFHHSGWHGGGGLIAWRQTAGMTTAGRVYSNHGSTRPAIASRMPRGDQLVSHYGAAYNSRTGALAAGQRAEVSNIRLVAHSASSASRTGTLTQNGGHAGNYSAGNAGAAARGPAYVTPRNVPSGSYSHSGRGTPSYYGGGAFHGGSGSHGAVVGGSGHAAGDGGGAHNGGGGGGNGAGGGAHSGGGGSNAGGGGHSGGGGGSGGGGHGGGHP
jgi:hypothetical protein